jgi:TPR repeat protein
MKRFSSILLICLCLVAAVFLAGCSAEDAGEEAYKKGDFTTAMAKFSAKDTPKSAFYQGLMLFKGEGVAQNVAEAARLFRKAADQGYADAQFNLGSMYGKGQGVPQDKQAALEWYMKAAAQGNAFAQFNIGLMYLNGDGVRQDKEAAMSWIRKSADKGNERAKEALQVLSTK